MNHLESRIRLVKVHEGEYILQPLFDDEELLYGIPHLGRIVVPHSCFLKDRLYDL